MVAHVHVHNVHVHVGCSIIVTKAHFVCAMDFNLMANGLEKFVVAVQVDACGQ